MTRGCVPDIFSGVDPLDIVMLDLGDMDLFGDYLATMESFLETRRQECSERLEVLRSEQQSGKILAVWPYDSDPPEIQAEEMWLQTFEGFANILRKSFFVSLYGWIESKLVEECYCRDDKWETVTNGGSKLKRAMQYLTRVQRIEFSLGESKEWSRINGDYRRLRDCIAHNEGKLNDRYSKQTELERYVDQEPALALSPYGDEIVLGPDFCAEAFSTIARFFRSVLVACGRIRLSRNDTGDTERQ